MKKFHAEKSITVDGITYNPGDIVYFEHWLPGLKICEEEKELPKQKVYPKNELFCAENPEISVIITFHNQREYFKKCIDGFQRQNFNKPYEVIAVVDKSDEDKEIQASFHNVKILKVEFGNASKSRNVGLEIAKGKFIAFFDGDDFPYGNYLKELYNALIINQNSDFAYARFDHELFGKKQGRLPRCNILEWSESWADFSPITNTPILIYKDKAPKWDERFEIYQDAQYGLSLKKLKLKGTHVREELWYYRHNPKSIWGQIDNTEKINKAKEILKSEYGMKDTIAKVTFISLISRDVVLDEYFKQIETLGIPNNSHWFIMVDSNSEQFINKIKDYQKKYEHQFLSSRMYVTGEDNLSYSRDFEDRGMRIANFIKIIINQVNERMGGTEYLFMVEDDTIAPKNAFKTLYPMIKGKPNVVYASGIECGRGFTRHTGICWLKRDEKKEIIGREIPAMNGIKPILKIGGGGWYCWIGRVRTLQEFYDKNKMRCFDGKMLGPDVMMVNDLSDKGFECLCNTTVQCKHYDERGKQWLEANTGRGYDIEFYKEDKEWKMILKEKETKKTHEWTLRK